MTKAANAIPKAAPAENALIARWISTVWSHHIIQSLQVQAMIPSRISQQIPITKRNTPIQSSSNKPE